MIDYNSLQIIMEHSDLLKGCSDCGLVWAVPARIFECHLSAERIIQMGYALVELNEQKPTAEDLYEYGILISHGFCQECFVKTKITHKIRQRQLQEGNFPCFGTACNGYCDQLRCINREICIRDINALPSTIYFYENLANQMRNHQAAFAA